MKGNFHIVFNFDINPYALGERDASKLWELNFRSLTFRVVTDFLFEP